MKRLLSLGIFLLGAAFGLQAQEQSAAFTHYHIAPILMNPAVAGFTGNHKLQMNVRSQWASFPGAPRTYAVGYDGPLSQVLGIGLNVLSENIASTQRLRLQLNYAFRFETGPMKAGIGFSTEFHTVKLARSVMSGQFYQPNDFLVEEAVDGLRIFDAALGAYALFNGQTYVNLAFPNLIVAKISDIESGAPEGSFFRYFAVALGHRIMVDAYNFTIEPSIMMRKMRNVPFQVDFNVLGGFADDKLIAGLSYRSGVGGAVGLLLGTKISAMRLYYSYDVSFQRFQQYNNGSHEITVQFEFPPGKKRFDHSLGTN